MTLTQGGVSTGANGNAEIGPGLPTTAVSIVHSAHPSGGAHLVRNHHGTRNSTLGFPPKKNWKKCFGKKKLVHQKQL